MAITRTEEDKAGQAGNAGQDTQHTAGMAGSAGGIDRFDDIGYDTLSGGVDTVGFTAFTKEMIRLSELPEANTIVNFKAIPITARQGGLPLPIIALTATVNNVTAVFSLLIERNLIIELEPFIKSIKDPNAPGGGYDVIYDKPTTRCYGEKARDTIGKAVAMKLNVNLDSILHISHCVVPKEEDLESDATTRMYFDSATLALLTWATNGKAHGITSANLTANNRVVRQHTRIVPADTKLNRSNQPIACDFNARLELTSNAGDQEQHGEIYISHSKYTLADVTGFIDFNIKEEEPLVPGQPIPATQPGYIPIVVLTEVAGLSKTSKSIEDLRTQLLGMTATANLTASHGWVRIFEETIATNNGKPSIGHLGLEHDPYINRTPPELGLVPVKSIALGTQPKEGTMTPLMVANTWCTMGVAVALDVEIGGRLSWVQDVFVSAAGAGDVNDAAQRIRSNDAIINECDALTSGIFSKMWSDLHPISNVDISLGARAPVVDAHPVTVHLGTYTGANGAVKDIRSIDYLTMLSLLPKDLDKLSTATTAMIPGMCNALTLTERRKAISALAGGDVNFTGLASRVFMAPGFIQTLISAMIQAGVSYVNDDTLGYGQENLRGGMNANLASNINSGGLYQSPFGNAAVAPGIPGSGFTNPMYN